MQSILCTAAVDPVNHTDHRRCSVCATGMHVTVRTEPARHKDQSTCRDDQDLSAPFASVIMPMSASYRPQVPSTGAQSTRVASDTLRRVDMLQRLPQLCVLRPSAASSHLAFLSFKRCFAPKRPFAHPRGRSREIRKNERRRAGGERENIHI